MKGNSKYGLITRVVDKYFSLMDVLDANHYIPELIPEEMKDTSRPPRFEGMMRWKAIPSTVTNAEITDLEHYVGHAMPASYKHFIQYRNFIEMHLGPYQVVFFKNLSSNWIDTVTKRIEFYDQDFIDRGLIPFADYSDYGVICFKGDDIRGSEAEYPIIWLDHEDGYDQEWPLAENFLDLFQLCEPSLDEWIKNREITFDE